MQLRLSMKMQMRITPQLVLSGELLRVSGAELARRIHQELSENPALEQVERGSTREKFGGNSADEDTNAGRKHRFDLIPYQRNPLPTFEDRLENIAEREPVINQLIRQAALLVDRKDLEVVKALLYSLDTNGYLRASPEQLAVDLGLASADINRLIPILHELEPAGIGARDLRECLLIQYRSLETEGKSCALAKQVIEQYWDDFAAQHWERLSKRLEVSKAELDDVHRFIAQNCYPHPLAMMHEDADALDALSSPDLIIVRRNQNGNTVFSLEIPAAEAFELRLNNSFTRFLEACSVGEQGSAQERDWMQMHMERARMFLASLQKRWETLRSIGEYIIEFQKGFLENGPSHLKLLTQAKIAHALGCHESTVSRALNDKVVQLPNGRLVPVDIFFDAALPVKAALRRILAESRKSISDREMSERLAQAGYFVARRTIAKYRAQLNQINNF